jgi:hypothetical protein
MLSAFSRGRGTSSVAKAMVDKTGRQSSTFAERLDSSPNVLRRDKFRLRRAYGATSSVSLTNSATENTCIFCITRPRCTLIVFSLAPS